MGNKVLDKIKGHPHPTDGTVYTILFIMGLCHLLNDMIQSVIPAMYPLLKDKFGFTFAQIGIITLVFQLTSSVFQPFVGHYADKHPQPYSLAAGMCFTLTGLVAIAFAPDFGFLLLSVALIGCGSSVFHPEASRVAQMASGGQQSLAQSIFQVGGNGGSAAGPLLAAIIVIPFGQHAVGWFAIAALVAAVLLVRVGAWYSMTLDYSKTSKGQQPLSAAIYPARTVRMALAILVLMIFSKYFFNACMTSYFTFRRGNIARRISRGPVRQEIRDTFLYSRCCPVRIGHAVPEPVLDDCNVCDYRTCHSIGIFCNRGLCHGSHAGQGRDDSRGIFRTHVRVGRYRFGVFRLARRFHEYRVHFPCKHMAAIARDCRPLPA